MQGSSERAERSVRFNPNLRSERVRQNDERVRSNFVSMQTVTTVYLVPFDRNLR